MTKQEYADLCYKIAKQRRFYDQECYNSIAAQLMHILSELGEAYNAHRKNKRSYLTESESVDEFKEGYTLLEFLNKYNIFFKDTFEDELANVLIRSYSFCGYFGINPEPDSYNETLNLLDNFKTIPEKLCILSEQLMTLRVIQGSRIGSFIQSMEYFCKQIGVDIYKYVDLKIEYNKSRPRLNGKEY